MTAREFLDQYKMAKARADKLRERVDELRDQLYDSTGGKGGIVYASAHGSGINKPTERKVEKVMQVRDEWLVAECEAVEMRQTVFSVISQIKDAETLDLLWFRYLGLFTWQDIQGALGKSQYCVHSRHRDALEQIQQILDQESCAAS